MINLEEINQKIILGEEIENIVKNINWREFEQFVSEILKHCDFEIFLNFRFAGKHRYEIDILAIKKSTILAIDCKQWNMGRYKSSGLRNAIKNQLRRCEELNKNLVGKYDKIIPLIVTLFEEDIVEYENVFVVPLWKLNEFLLNNLEL